MAYTVYGTRRSSNFSIEAALALAGANYDFVDVNLDADAQRDEAWARINPTRKIPALKLPTGEIVTESSAILLTIADRYPQKKLLPPSGSAERAQAYRWLAFFASEVYPMVEIVDYPGRFCGKAGKAKETQELARERVRERFTIFENRDRRRSVDFARRLVGGRSLCREPDALVGRQRMARWRIAPRSKSSRVGWPRFPRWRPSGTSILERRNDHGLRFLGQIHRRARGARSPTTRARWPSSSTSPRAAV